VEFTQFIVVPKVCRFRPDVLPPGVTNYFFDIQPLFPIPGRVIERTIAAFTNLGVAVAQIALDNEKCDIPLNIPFQVGSGMFGSCNIFPVRWFENANDVPH